MFRTVALVIAAAATFVAVPALAGPNANNWNVSDSDIVETIDISGVNFNNAAEVKDLYKSMRYAAARVCATSTDPACRKEALAEAVAQINQPQLALQHEQRTGERTGQLAWNQASR